MGAVWLGCKTARSLWAAKGSPPGTQMVRRVIGQGSGGGAGWGMGPWRLEQKEKVRES